MKQWRDRVVQGRWSRPAFAAVAVAGAAIAFSPSAAWQVVTQVGQFLAAYPVTVVLLVAAVAALVDQGRRIGRRKPVAGRWPWLLSDRGIFVVVGLMACVGAAVMGIMLVLAHTVDGVERTKLQLDAIKYGLGVIAAAGGVAALLLSVRRQRHTEEDAEEQRMTDIYTAAVEQLGHAEAPVRLGGMYALERLAQANPSQRQTVVNVLCAYLRMPFVPGDAGDSPQEFQVRLTAQWILIEHLTRPEQVSTAAEADALSPNAKEPFWPNIDLDLTGAFLNEFKANNCHVRRAYFRHATFSGSSGFRGATFGEDAWFYGASFDGFADFGGAAFGGVAVFDGISFGGFASFGMVSFEGIAGFEQVTFSRAALFDGATIAGDISFSEAAFGGGHPFEGPWSVGTPGLVRRRSMVT
ncbi:pentapeptide repeat-containing protein [Melissospora conviva]|uniref:pentapeptide repeat-containing protein n=1 Tax=Melissospora conviva TaxID=3388432 RepID=UPI003B7D97A8